MLVLWWCYHSDGDEDYHYQPQTPTSKTPLLNDDGRSEAALSSQVVPSFEEDESDAPNSVVPPLSGRPNSCTGRGERIIG